MYIMLGFGCLGVAFLMALNRKGLPAVVLALLGAGLLYAGLTSQP
jgi:uncharacterized membrane protein